MYKCYTITFNQIWLSISKQEKLEYLAQIFRYGFISFFFTYMLENNYIYILIYNDEYIIIYLYIKIKKYFKQKTLIDLNDNSTNYNHIFKYKNINIHLYKYVQIHIYIYI